jgi:NAD(P)-dependent dehydrogenase (short-subunit alcohol dehydrogenase family)
MFPRADSADETEEAFDKIVAVNLKGVWAWMKHELKQMREQGYAELEQHWSWPTKPGAIVNCSSPGGLVGGAGVSMRPST